MQDFYHQHYRTVVFIKWAVVKTPYTGPGRPLMGALCGPYIYSPLIITYTPYVIVI